MPTMISSAVMTRSFSLPGRLSVSSPFEVLRRAIGRPARGTLYLSESVYELDGRHAGEGLGVGSDAKHINTYLDFRIPDTFPQPITLKHLMTHTSGFGERWLESLASDESKLISERECLISNMPARIFAPGEAVGYSNYNAMLAGYIVSRISGQPYSQYIQEHILDPLGMSHSTATSPAPPELQPHLSGGYAYADGGFEPVPNYMDQPAGFHYDCRISPETLEGA